MQRVDQLIGHFLKQHYGVPLREVYGTLRRRLLEDMETVACNLCGGEECLEIARRDKFNLAVKSVLCRKCGLIYLNPRPTARSYDRFYSEGGSEEGVYHVALSLQKIEGLLARHYGPQFRMSSEDGERLRFYMRGKYAEHLDKQPNGLADDQLFLALEEKAREFEAWRYEVYAEDLYRQFNGVVPRKGKMFEVGASWGKLLVPWRDRHGCEVTGVEPRKATVQAAKERLGIELFEGFPATAPIPEDTFDAVLIARTINHMINPYSDLRHAWRWLKPGGTLLIDISDAIREARYEGFENNVVEIDHPYMFSGATLSAMVQKAGFEIFSRDVVDMYHVLWGDRHRPEYKQIRLVARKSLQPVNVTWPDPLQELADLLEGQLEREKELLLLARPQKKVLSAKKKEKADLKARKKVEKVRKKHTQKTAKRPGSILRFLALRDAERWNGDHEMRWMAGRGLVPLVFVAGFFAALLAYLGSGVAKALGFLSRVAGTVGNLGAAVREEVQRFRREIRTKALDLVSFAEKQQATNPLPADVPTVFLLITCGQAVRNFLVSDVLDLLKQRYNVVILTPYAYSQGFFEQYSKPGVHVLPWFESFRTISERAFQYYFMDASPSRTHQGWLTNLEDRAANSTTRRFRYRKLVLMRRLSNAVGSLIGRRGMQGLYSSYFMAYLPKSLFTNLLATYHPRLVISTTSHHAEAWPLTYFARRNGIKTLANILSWDNTTTKTLMDISCNYTTVWSEEMREEFAVQFPHIKTKLIVTGSPLFDIYSNKPNALTREAFLSEVGLDPAKPYILYTTNTPAAMADESEVVSQYWEALSTSPLAGKVGMLVRLHPKETDKRYTALIEGKHKDLVVTQAGRSHWDQSDRWLPNQADIRLLLNSMLHAAVSVNVASTMSLESFALGLPTINIAFRSGKDVKSSPSMWSFDMYHTSEHYHALVDNGAVDVARSLEELVAMTMSAIEQGTTRKEAMRRTLEQKAAYCDGTSARRFVEVIDGIVQPSKVATRAHASATELARLPHAAQPAE